MVKDENYPFFKKIYDNASDYLEKITSLYKISKTRTNYNNDNFTFH